MQIEILSIARGACALLFRAAILCTLISVSLDQHKLKRHAIEKRASCKRHDHAVFCMQRKLEGNGYDGARGAASRKHVSPEPRLPDQAHVVEGRDHHRGKAKDLRRGAGNQLPEARVVPVALPVR